jgi:PAS domain-containing protein
MDDPGSAPDAEKEAARLRAVNALKACDGSVDDPRFLRIVRLAAHLFAAPNAALLLIEEHSLWRKAGIGDAKASLALADLLIERPEPVMCGDAGQDATLHDAVSPGVCFLACAPLIDPEGHVVGLLTVEDPASRASIDPADRQALADLAGLAMTQLLDGHKTTSGFARNLDSERLALAIGAASLGEFEWDRALDIYRISPRLAKIANLPEGVIPAEDGQSLFPYVHIDDRAEIQRDVDAQLRKRGRYEVEFRRNPDADRRGPGHHRPQGRRRPAREPAHRAGPPHQEHPGRRAVGGRPVGPQGLVAGRLPEGLQRPAEIDEFGPRPAQRRPLARRHPGADRGRRAGRPGPNQTRWDGPELFLTPARRRPCR